MTDPLTMLACIRDMLDLYDRETCTHEETVRGGTIWTICPGCGRRWADDEGGFVPYADPPAILAARAILAAGGQPQGSGDLGAYWDLQQLILRLAGIRTQERVILRQQKAIADALHDLSGRSDTVRNEIDRFVVRLIASAAAADGPATSAPGENDRDA